MELYSVIKYEGDNDVFVWKHPCEDFNIGTNLIVHESQEAVFFKDGRALDLFESGKYNLSAENLPILNKIINIPSGGITTFHCEIYFINKVDHMAIKWGTDNKIQYIDPKYDFPLKLGASGEMILSIKNSRELLTKMVGTEEILVKNDLVNNFRAFLLSRVKNYLVNTIIKNEIGIFDIDSYITKISEDLKKLLIPDFNEYGISLDQFFVTSFVKPEEDDNYIRLNRLFADRAMSVQEAQIRQNVNIVDEETKAKKRIIESESLASKRKLEGYTYQEERGFDVAQDLATNEATGNYTNAGIGLGMMTSIGNTMNNTMNMALNNNGDFKFCKICGNKLPSDAIFCSKCGEKQ